MTLVIIVAFESVSQQTPDYDGAVGGPTDSRFMPAERSRYTAAMSRFAPSQLDLFAPAPEAPARPERAPLEELAELLALLRAADRLPWPDLATTMAEERRAYGLARLAGAEGARLAAAIMDETERLFSAAEQEAARAAAAP
jgi:hypothetical protein